MKEEILEFDKLRILINNSGAQFLRFDLFRMQDKDGFELRIVASDFEGNPLKNFTNEIEMYKLYFYNV